MLPYIKYLKYFFFKKYPAEITFFVTASCNFRCRHCFNWQNIEKVNPEKELSIGEIEKITKTIPSFLRLSLSGGEPFLRKDLVQICRAFYENCDVKFITIPTNASLPEKIKSDVEDILKTCPGLHLHVSLSLDGLGKDRDYAVGRENTISSLENSVDVLKELQKKYSNLGIGVITTQTPLNENTLDQIYEYATKTLEVDNFGFNIARTGAKEEAETGGSLDKYKQFIEKLMARKNSSKLDFFLRNIFVAKRNLVFKRVLKANREKKFLSPCFSGKLRIVISETGDVYPCETLQYSQESKKILMGNLRDFNLDFKKLFFSEKAQKTKKNIKKSKCFCAHECDLETNILFNLRFFPRLLLEIFKNFKR